jgi:hypothetical protein
MADAIDRLEMTELPIGHQIHIDVAAHGYAGLCGANGVHERPFASATGCTEIATMFRRLGATG